MITNGFEINPYHELMPDYKICPFNTCYLRKNRKLPASEYSDAYFNERFNGRDWIYTLNGREAIHIALSFYHLKRTDYVTILTTSGNTYISGCVTKEIEKFCNWSRKIEQNTKLILVNHEFGYPYLKLNDLKQYNIPIIEDCAHSFFSTDELKNTGTVGDFLILSIPKMFPVQIGGILVSNYSVDFLKQSRINSETKLYLKNVLSYNLVDREVIIKKRLLNYRLFCTKFGDLGLDPYFELRKGTIPGVFLFRADRINIELPKLKEILRSHGIQCSVFYGENAFFLPCHQNLFEEDIDYFVEIIKKFVK